MWDNHLYFAGTLYRSAHIGAPQPNTGIDSSGAPLGINIRGVAPYWRVAWQQTSKNNYLMVGTYGIHVKSTPGGLREESPAWKTATPTGPPISRTIERFRNSGAMCFRSAALIFARILRFCQHSAMEERTSSSITSIPSRPTRSITSATSTRPPSDISMSPERRISRFILAGPISGNANGDPRSSGVRRQHFVVARSEHWPNSAVHGLYAIQRRRHELRWHGTQCQLQQHALSGRAIRFLGSSEDKRELFDFGSRHQSAAGPGAQFTGPGRCDFPEGTRRSLLPQCLE